MDLILKKLDAIEKRIIAVEGKQRMYNLHNKEYWTVEELAWYLNAKMATIYSYTHKRLIPYHKANGFNLFKKVDVYAFIEKNRLKSRDEVGGDMEALMLS
jgi:excisionase family DNA binding protein